MLNIDCCVTASVYTLQCPTGKVDNNNNNSCFVTALIEYLDRFNAVQDERQSVIKGLLVKMGGS